MLPTADVTTIVAAAPVAFAFGVLAGMVISTRYQLVRKNDPPDPPDDNRRKLGP